MTNLTQPRYLVIADYPDSLFQIGDISNAYVVLTKSLTFGYPEDYPHLFRLLHWSECLTDETIPQYVKNIQSKKIYRVRNFHKTDMKAYDINGKFMNLKLYLPATLNEYNEYIKNK
jgi:hypothetical protein